MTLLAGLLGKKDGVDVGKNTTRGNGDTSKELVQLFIVLDGKSDVAAEIKMLHKNALALSL